MKRAFFRCINIIFIIVIMCITLIVIPININKINNNNGVVVLAYHHVVSDEDKEKYFKNDLWTTSESDFYNQMEYLSNNEFNVLTMQQFYDWKINGISIPDKSVLITFDDGYNSMKEYVYPILDKFNFSASLFMITSQIRDESKYESGIKYKLSFKEIDEIKDHIEVYSHTHDYHKKEDGIPYLEIKDTSDIYNDIKLSLKYTSNIAFAYPYGAYSDNAINALNKLDIEIAFTIAENYNATLDSNNYKIPRYCMLGFYDMNIFRYFVNDTSYIFIFYLVILDIFNLVLVFNMKYKFIKYLDLVMFIINGLNILILISFGLYLLV